MDKRLSGDDDIVWSDDTMTIRDVIYSSMPAVVRVAQGYLGVNEAESFSRGDLLKLDFVKSIQKVYATVVSSWTEAILEDHAGYMQPDKEIIIPLGYRGKVLIIRPPSENKPYHTVAELMKDFPRFVRVDVPFFAFSNEDHAIQIDVGKKLELDRYLPTKGLVAKYEGQTVVISDSVRSRFRPLDDPTEYTLMEVIDRLPLPQFVRFVEDEFEKVLTTDLTEAVENVQNFTGCVKLKRVFREEVVVGHHKPQIPDYMKKEGEKYVQRSIVLLPLGRDAVNEIEVNVPIYSEPDEYELLVVRNFTQKSPNMDIVDGSLYLEFAKNPKGFYVLEDDEDSHDEVFGSPPPLPPRPNHRSEDDQDGTKPPKIPPRPVSVSEDYEVVNPTKPPPIVPRSFENTRKFHTDNSTSDVPKSVNTVKSENHDLNEELDGPLMIYEVSDNPYNDDIKLPQRTKDKVAVPMPFYKKLKRVHTELIMKLKPKGHSKLHPVVPPVAVSQPLPSPTYNVKASPIQSPFTTSPEQMTNNFPFTTSQLSNVKKEGHMISESPETHASNYSTQKAKDDHKTKHYDKPVSSNVNTENKQVKRPKPKVRKGKGKTDVKVVKKETGKVDNKTTVEHVSDGDEPDSDYDYPDVSPPKKEVKVAKKEVKVAKKEVKNTKKDVKDTKKENKQIETKTSVEHVSDDSDNGDYDYPDMSQISITPPHPQTQSRPIVRVQPSTREVPTPAQTGLSQMSVKELVICLNQCALPKIAVLCQDNAIDGKFISALTEEEMREKPFSMNSIEVAKIKRMKEGWRPKME